jgi:hypothetical protein
VAASAPRWRKAWIGLGRRSWSFGAVPWLECVPGQDELAAAQVLHERHFTC